MGGDVGLQGRHLFGEGLDFGLEFGLLGGDLVLFGQGLGVLGGQLLLLGDLLIQVLDGGGVVAQGGLQPLGLLRAGLGLGFGGGQLALQFLDLVSGGFGVGFELLGDLVIAGLGLVQLLLQRRGALLRLGQLLLGGGKRGIAGAQPVVEEDDGNDGGDQQHQQHDLPNFAFAIHGQASCDVCQENLSILL